MIIPTLAVGMVTLLGFIALAIDLGMIAVARTQCQNAADAAAMAGARALNGDSSGGYNQTGAQDTATTTATTNTIQGNAVPSSNVNIQIGSYTYDYSSAQFTTNIPTLSTDTPNLVTSTVTASGNNIFGRLLGAGTFNLSATATAVHRPRDVAVILDMSGSMRFDSLMGIPYYGSRTQSNNPDSIYPQFGHYSSTSSAALQNTTADTISGNTYGLANISTSTDGGDPVIGDFQSSALGASNPTTAFSLAPDSYATSPNGDDYLHISNNANKGYATNLSDVSGSTSSSNSTNQNFYSKGYKYFTGTTFKGYTQGPRYWGKTFFIWPPDPTKDWRSLYFNVGGSSTTGITDNSLLWNSSGWRAPSSSTYDINYSAILAWIKTSPNPFPNQLRAGRILYYDSIPSSISTSSYPPSDPNQRFWKEYIDYVLGVYQKSSNSYDVITSLTGYGDDYSWGTVKISSGTTLNPADNPKRPRTHFWFGPMSMIDFLGNYNMWSQYSNWNPYWPGNCHESPIWACKLGVQAALKDIQNNHPNDFISLMYFNTPKYSSSSSDGGSFNKTRVALGRDYTRLSDTLWFPPSTIDTPGTEIRPYDSDNLEVPRAYNGTTTVMGFMLAFNQFSSNSTLRTWAPAPAQTGEAGGLGRKGAQRLVILQTDGMANNLAAATFVNGGAYNSYYKIRQPGEYPTNSGSDVNSQIYSVVNQICALDTASPPGYSTTRKPVLIHCLALGPIFDPSNNNSQMTPALDLLQTIQTIGSVQDSASTPLADYKIITGTSSSRTDKIRQAFSAIMQDGVQVSLIK